MKRPTDAATELLLNLGQYHSKNPSAIPKQWSGRELSEQTGMNVEDLNNAVDVLESKGLIKRLNWKQTKPFDFGAICINVMGKEAYCDILEQLKEPESSNFYAFI